MKAKGFDKKFDSGESIVQYLELERTARPGQEQRRVNVDFPAWMVSQLDREAKRLVTFKSCGMGMFQHERAGC